MEDQDQPQQKSPLDLELESLATHAGAYRQSIERMEASHVADPATIALEKRNLAQVLKRADQLGKVKSSIGGTAMAPAIPSVQ